MPKIDLKRISEDAARGQFAPVYFLHGDEPLLTRRAVETLVAAAVDRATADFNYDVFHGGDLNPERLATLLATPPMMAPRRVILVRELERAGAREKAMLADYARKPSADMVLVLAAGERVRIDQKKQSPKWAWELQECAATLLSWPLREPELVRWVSERAAALGKRLDRRAAYALYSRSGSDLARLEDDLEKLAIFCGDRPEITAEDVVGMTGIERGGTVFDWVEALAAGEGLKAAYLAGYLVSRGESAVGAVAIAASHFITLGRAAELLARRMPEKAAIAKLGLFGRPPEAVQALLAQARSLDRGALSRALELLLETDLRLKSSSLPDRLILEELSLALPRELAERR